MNPKIQLTIYYQLNKEKHIRTRTLSRRIRDDNFRLTSQEREELTHHAELLLTAEETFHNGAGTMIAIQNIRFQMIQDL